MTTLAAKLRLGGYRTHMVGKWDAGMATPEHTPYGRGYDSWYGYYQHANDYWGKSAALEAIGEVDVCLNHFVDLSETNATYRGGVLDRAQLDAACQNSTALHPPCYEEALFRARALRIISEHELNQPLFLVHAFHLVHTPLQVPLSFIQLAEDSLTRHSPGLTFDDVGRRNYSAMVRYMDGVVGDLVDAVKARGMWADTLLVFTADNGGPIYSPGSANNHPLRGGKFSDFEGGVRVNAFVSGGFVPVGHRGTEYSGVVSIADWYGVFCELAGVDPTDIASEEANAWLRPRGLPLLAPVDAVRGLWAAILNSTLPGGTMHNVRPILHVSENCVIQFPFKLITGPQEYGTWTGPLYPNCTQKYLNGTDVPGKPLAGHAIKLFDQAINFSASATIEDKLTWTHDCGAGCLFDIERDPGEHQDLATTQPAELARLRTELAQLNLALFRPGRGVMDVEACYQGVAHAGYYGPFGGGQASLDAFYTNQYNPTRQQRLEDDSFKAEVAVVGQPAVQAAAVSICRKYFPAAAAKIDLDPCPSNTSEAAAVTIAAAVRQAIRDAKQSPGARPREGLLTTSLSRKRDS